MKLIIRLRLVISFAALLSFCLLAKGAATAEDVQKWGELMTGTTKALRANDVAGAIQQCEAAMAMASGFGSNDTHLAQSQVLRAEVYMWEKKNDLAENTFKLAIATCEQAAGSNDPVVVHPLSSLANFYYFVAHRNELVVPLFERILTITESATNHTSRDVIMWTRNLGMIYQQTGQFSKAEPMFKNTVSLAEKTDADWLPHELLNSADFYRAWGRPKQAESLAKRALAIREKATKPDAGIDAQMDMAVCLNNLGATYLAWGKPGKAETAYRRSLALVQKFMDADQADLTPIIEGLAAALRAQGKYDQAEPFYQRALALTEKNLGVNSPQTAMLLEKYAGLLNDMKKPEAAEKLAARAEDIRKQNAAASN